MGVHGLVVGGIDPFADQDLDGALLLRGEAGFWQGKTEGGFTRGRKGTLIDCRALVPVIVKDDKTLLLVTDNFFPDFRLHLVRVDGKQPAIELLDGDANHFLNAAGCLQRYGDIIEPLGCPYFCLLSTPVQPHAFDDGFHGGVLGAVDFGG